MPKSVAAVDVGGGAAAVTSAERAGLKAADANVDMGDETWRVQIDGDITCTEQEITRTVLRIRLMLKQAGIPKTESLTVKSWLVEQLSRRPDPMRVPGHESEHVKR